MNWNILKKLKPYYAKLGFIYTMKFTETIYNKINDDFRPIIGDGF